MKEKALRKKLKVKTKGDGRRRRRGSFIRIRGPKKKGAKAGEIKQKKQNSREKDPKKSQKGTI